jgi:MYXO-CTERM domain-containing protein
MPGMRDASDSETGVDADSGGGGAGCSLASGGSAGFLGWFAVGAVALRRRRRA